MKLAHSLRNSFIPVPDGLLKLLLWFLVLRCHSESVSLLLQCSHLHTQQCYLKGDQRDGCMNVMNVMTSLWLAGAISLWAGGGGAGGEEREALGRLRACEPSRLVASHCPLPRGRSIFPGERMPHARLELSGTRLQPWGQILFVHSLPQHVFHLKAIPRN